MPHADHALGEFGLASTRLAPWATMKGSKPSLRCPRRTSMVGMDLATIYMAPLIAQLARRHPGITFDVDLTRGVSIWSASPSMWPSEWVN